MVQARVISPEEIQALEERGKKIKGRREYRRLQSVLMRAREKKTAEEIAAILGIHARTVEKHHQRYFEEGMKAFEARKPGPTGPRILSVLAERDLFETLRDEAAKGKLVNASRIKTYFEEKAGQSCANSTVYRAIHRNQWSKKNPRPRHPRGNEEAKCLFKKTE